MGHIYRGYKIHITVNYLMPAKPLKYKSRKKILIIEKHEESKAGAKVCQ